jgi:hypothetical protein
LNQLVLVAPHHLWDLGYRILLWILKVLGAQFLQDPLILLLVQWVQVVLLAQWDLTGLVLLRDLVLLVHPGLLCLLLHLGHQRDQLVQMVQMVLLVLQDLCFQMFLGVPFVQIDLLALRGQKVLVVQAVLKVLVLLWNLVVLVGQLDSNQVYQEIQAVLWVQHVL